LQDPAIAPVPDQVLNRQETGRGAEDEIPGTLLTSMLTVP
jgi:hypothetical protein